MIYIMVQPFTLIIIMGHVLASQLGYSQKFIILNYDYILKDKFYKE